MSESRTNGILNPRAGLPPRANPRIGLVLRLEWTLLATRYFGYFSLVVMYALEIAPDILPNLWWITLGVVLHNSYAHWVLYTRDFRRFLSRANFFLHLFSISLVVGLTGAEESPLGVLYLLLVIGYSMCSPQFRNIYLVALLCAFAYAATILLSWMLGGMNLAYPVVLHFVGIFACGWLMNGLGEMLRKAELDAQQRAQALAASEATLRTILDSTASPIVVCDETELIADLNNGACEFIGLPREQMLGRRIRSFIFDDGTLPNKLATLRTKGAYHGETLVITASGDERTVNLLVRSFIRDNQRFFVAMLHDITEQKNLQETTRLANLQLESVNRELKQVNDLRNEFYTTVSRRLRSPLSSILGFTDLLLNEELGTVDTEQRSALQSCRRSILRVFDMVDEAFEPAALGTAEAQPDADPEAETAETTANS